MDHDKTATRTAGVRNRIRTGPDSPTQPDARRVRAHIQRIALGLFIEQGYDKTSLREIAEQLGVTKAALYYHFPTKEDIVTSLVEQRVAAVEELIGWARSQPDPERMRLEFVRRYAAGLHDVHRHQDVLLFFEQNKTLVNTLRAGHLLREQMTRIFELLAEPEEPLAQQLCRVMSIFSIHAGWGMLRDRGTDEERRQATLDVALQIMRNADHQPG